MKEDEPQEYLPKTPRGGPQTFRLGDTVCILAGPFAAFTGKVDGTNQSKVLLKVKVKIFGEETFIKPRFAEVEKVSFS